MSIFVESIEYYILVYLASSWLILFGMNCVAVFT